MKNNLYEKYNKELIEITNDLDTKYEKKCENWRQDFKHKKRQNFDVLRYKKLKNIREYL